MRAVQDVKKKHFVVGAENEDAKENSEEAPGMYIILLAIMVYALFDTVLMIIIIN